MIISAYAGTGKSTFALQIGSAVDLTIMPFKWMLPFAEKTSMELEKEKGALYHLPNPLFPENYIVDILRAEGEFDYVLIPTDAKVIRDLQEKYDRKILLCYPEDECREEYRERFIVRGNSESFLSLFSDGWDHFLDPVKENQLGVHIVMKPGQYLTDLDAPEERCFLYDIRRMILDDYRRGFAPANYSSDGIAYFQGISMDMLRQLMAEGFLNPFERQNDSPTVKEMMDFCAGEDEDNWIFRGYTVSPERIDYRVSIEGFEARTEPLAFRKKEFAQFNHKASKLFLEEGECYCWYD